MRACIATWLLLLGLGAVCTSPPVFAAPDLLSDIERLRANGCTPPNRVQPHLERLHTLDTTARLWAEGAALREALQRSGYVATEISTLHLRGTLETLSTNRDGCQALRNAALRHVGVYQSGHDSYIVLTAPAYPDAADLVTDRVLDLVNAARNRGRQCGGRFYPAVGELRLSLRLIDVAADHAQDMVRRNYFEHVDLDGHTPADRVKASGYRERLVGENIAYGPVSAEEVVAGWLASPGHCENIMDPRFSEMGLAIAPAPPAASKSRRGPYWVQLLVQPANPG